MNSLARSTVFTASGLLTFIAIAANSVAEPEITVCKLTESGKLLDGQRVRLKAVFLSDLMHKSVLKDKDCPDESVTPFYGENRDDPTVRAFQVALGGELNDLELRVMLIEVTGVYRWNEGRDPHSELVMDKIWTFKRVHGNWREAE